MCQRNAVTEKDGAIVGTIAFSPMTEKERLAEIDMRVGARMMELEMRKEQWARGFWDCFYFFFIVASVVYIYWIWKQQES